MIPEAGQPSFRKLRPRGLEGCGMRNTAVDLNGYDAACVVEFNGAGCSENRIAAQARQCHENTVFHANRGGVFLDVGKSVIVTTSLGQNKAQVRDVARL